MARQPLTPLGEQSDLVGHRHGRRVDVEGARPGHCTVRGLGRQLDAPAAGCARDGRHLLGASNEVGRLLRPDVDRGGKPDRAVDNDAHAHAEFGVVRRGLGVGVVQAHDLAADALHPELRRLAARCGVERGIRERREFVRRERHQPTGVGWRTGRPAAV